MDGQADNHPFVGRKKFRQVGMPMQKKAIGADAYDRFRPMPPRETGEIRQIRMNRGLTAQKMKFIYGRTRTPGTHPMIGVRYAHVTVMIVVGIMRAAFTCQVAGMRNVKLQMLDVPALCV